MSLKELIKVAADEVAAPGEIPPLLVSLQSLEATLADEKANGGSGNLEDYNDVWFSYEGSTYNGPELAQLLAASEGTMPATLAPGLGLPTMAPAAASLKTQAADEEEIPLPGEEEAMTTGSGHHYNWTMFELTLQKKPKKIAALSREGGTGTIKITDGEASEYFGRAFGSSMPSPKNWKNAPKAGGPTVHKHLWGMGYYAILRPISADAATLELYVQVRDKVTFRQKATGWGYQFDDKGNMTGVPEGVNTPNPTPPAGMPPANASLEERIEKHAMAIINSGVDIVELLSFAAQCPDCTDEFLQQFER